MITQERLETIKNGSYHAGMSCKIMTEHPPYDDELRKALEITIKVQFSILSCMVELIEHIENHMGLKVSADAILEQAFPKEKNNE